MSKPEKRYIGDSVYADFDGYHIVLTTENGHGPSNTIALEPEVVRALNGYVKHVQDFYNERDDHHANHEADMERAEAQGDNHVS